MSQLTELLLYIYRTRLEEILLMIVLGVVIWIIAGIFLSKKARGWKTFNLIVFISICIGIVYATILSRTPGDGREVCLIPFYTFYKARENAELYRSMLMNLFLFLPFGLTLPNVLGGRHPIRWSALIVVLLSTVIELIQFIFALGSVEVDDILCNVTGGLIGVVTYLMSEKIRGNFKRIKKTRFVVVLSVIDRMITFLEYGLFHIQWALLGAKKPNAEAVQDVIENVTFIFKSFERQQMAKRLYRNIQSYYPGVRVIIADDSAKALELQDENLKIIQLPFNSGLSRGLNEALNQVETPFVVRMDDDQLLTPFTRVEEQVEFLKEHKEVDLVGILLYHMPRCRSLKKAAEEYYAQPMAYAPKQLLIPHLTEIDDTHIVVGKSSNTFVAHTDKMKEIGYDNHIRMIDHNEFFYRAAGNLVSVLDKSAFVLHYRNHFDMQYNKYRADIQADKIYILNKHRRKREKTER